MHGFRAGNARPRQDMHAILQHMSATPPDPQPGDFDAALAVLAPDDVSVAEPDTRPEVILQETAPDEAE